ncbi:hypothetical protein BT69DRAFT_1346471 [Atractiella rhizophila]|nr:hypothetical protein BT69DRAFT_1346471 [Atractiella rhizophila]
MSSIVVPVLDSSEPRTRDNIHPFKLPKKSTSSPSGEFDPYSVLCMAFAAMAVFTKGRAYAFFSFMLAIMSMVIKGFGTGQTGSAGLMMSMTAMTQVYMPMLVDQQKLNEMAAARAAASATPS